MYDLVVVGDIGYDVNTYPKRDNGKDVVITQMGGAVIYSAVPASFVSKKVGIFSVGGDDCPISYFTNFGIATYGFKNFIGKSSRFIHTYLSADGQQRTFRAEINPNVVLNINEFPSEYLNSKYIHIATNLPENQIKLINYLRLHTKAKISIDTLEDYLEQQPEKVLEAFSLADINFIDKEFKLLLNESTAPIKIIKKGKEGCIYKSKEYEISVPAPIVDKVVDKTGAGDCVCGVFLSLMAQTNDIKFSLKTACEVASASITQYGVNYIPFDFNSVKNKVNKLRSI